MKPPAIDRTWWFAFTLAVLAACNALAWSAMVPPDGAANDEQAHMDVVEYVSRTGTMPRLGAPGFEVYGIPTRLDGRDVTYPYQPYATHPPAAYLLAAAGLRAAPDDASNEDRHRWARGSQAVLVALLVVAAFGTVRWMLPRRPVVGAVAVSLIALWPQVAYLGAYVNADMIATVASAGLIGAWFAGARSGWRVGDALLLGILLGLVLLSKMNAWPLVAATPLVAALTLRSGWRHAGARLALALAAMAAVAGPWVAMQLHRYDGDLTARALQHELIERADATPIDGPSNGVSYVELLTEQHWIGTTTRSFVLGLPRHETTYEATAFAILTIGGAVGLLLLALRLRWRLPAVGDRPHLVAAALLPGIVVLASWNAWHGDIYFQGQGRYLFPALLPAIAYMVVGCARLVEPSSKTHRLSAALGLIVIATACLALGSRSLATSFETGSDFLRGAAYALAGVLGVTACAFVAWSSRCAQAPATAAAGRTRPSIHR